MILSGQKRLLGIGEMHVTDDPSELLMAPNLGSCLGITVFDPIQKRGGAIHCMLPLSTANPDKAKQTPGLYVDSGVTKLLSEVLGSKGRKESLQIVVVGGASINDPQNHFEVGKRNFTVFRKVVWKNNLLIRAEDVGGNVPRTISLAIGTGEVVLKVQGETKILIPGAS